jgi:hypothetical protein
MMRDGDRVQSIDRTSKLMTRKLAALTRNWELIRTCVVQHQGEDQHLGTAGKTASYQTLLTKALDAIIYRASCPMARGVATVLLIGGVQAGLQKLISHKEDCRFT